MRRVLLTGAATAAMAFCLASATQAKTYKLTVAAGQAPRALASLKMLGKYFIPEVNKRLKAMGSKHKIRWRQAYTGSLLKPTKVFLGTQDGVADIGYVPTIFHPDKLPLDAVAFMAPFCTDDLSKVTNAINAVYAKVPQMDGQYSKFNLIRLNGSGVDSYQLLTNFPVKSLADMKGKKIGTAGSALQWLRGIGVTSVQAHMFRYYNDTKTGIYQGFIIMGSPIPPMKYPEVAPYVTRVNFGAMYAVALVMNKDSMKKLPADVQKAIRGAAKSWGPIGDKGHIGAGKWGWNTGKKMFKKATFSEFPQAERVKWANAMPNIAKEWAARMEKKGLPGNKVLSLYMDALRAQGVKCARNWDKK
jgi:TRAP-type C4-dicarboxylate transport system substrate-binding protein